MKKSIYLVSILSILSFDGCLGKPQKIASEKESHEFLKRIPKDTCLINGGSPKYSKVCTYVKYVDAKQICQDVGGRLPTLEDIKALAIDCGVDFSLNEREFMKKDRQYSLRKKYKECLGKTLPYYSFWTSTFVPGTNLEKVYTPRRDDIRKITSYVSAKGNHAVICINPSVK